MRVSGEMHHEAVGLADLALPGDVIVVLDGSSATLQSGGCLPLLDTPKPSAFTRLSVRAIDVVLSAIGLVFAMPLTLALALMIRAQSNGPAIFRSERIAQRHGHFMMLKLRTMRPTSDCELNQLLAQNQPLAEEYHRSFKMRDDPRITPIGRFLRKTNLDELPQFWNVLRGDMSIVGPRPKLISEGALYGEAIDTVLRVKPGLTGQWQVSGRNDLTFDERIRIDVDYALNRSLWVDAKIVMRTAVQMLSPHRNGAY